MSCKTSQRCSTRSDGVVVRCGAQRLAGEALAAIEQGGTQVGEDYDLPEVDNLALRARRAEDGYLDRMRATYTGGVDGWIDDGLAFTRP